MKNELIEVQEHSDYGRSLVDLPPEILVKILSYLPTSDKIKAQYICGKFRDISETPLLWRNFRWPDNEPLQARSFTISNFVKAHGEHVRHMFFPSHVTPVNILLMMRSCGKMTRLSLPYNTRLTLNHLEKIVRVMANLQELDIFISELINPELDDDTILNFDRDIKRLLNITGNMKKLMLRFYDCLLGYRLVNCIGERVIQRKSLPQVIYLSFNTLSSVLFEFWSTANIELPSIEIGLYDAKKVPLNLYPSVPVRKFWYASFGFIIPPFVKFSNHGIFGLKYDTFYLNDYDHYGEVRHTVTPQYAEFCEVKRERLNCIGNLHSVSNIDFSDVDIYSGHLEQVAIACPNLERLNLMENVRCLQNLEGLRAMVCKCRCLQGLNLSGISVASVESYLLLWELLSSIKKLTHLAIDLCMLTLGDSHNSDRQKVIDMFRRCGNLQALETSSCQHADYENVEDLLFCHFPSLVYISLTKSQCKAALNYTVTNCSQLKYFCYTDCIKDSVALPLSSSCHLQQLCLQSHSTHISASFADVLSAHGELERVVLLVNSIVTSAIKTFISNSPNLLLLYVETTKLDGSILQDRQGFLNDDGSLNDDLLRDFLEGLEEDREDYKDKISKAFPHHKLFAVGDFTVTQPKSYKDEIQRHLDNNTEFNSFWTSASRL